MSAPLATAFVDVLPTPGSFKRGLQKEIDGAGAGVTHQTQSLSRRIGNQFSQMGRTVGGEVGEIFYRVGEGIDHVGDHMGKLGGTLLAGGGVIAGVGLLLTRAGAAEKQATDQLRQAVLDTGNAFSDYKDRTEEAIKSGEQFGHHATDTMSFLQQLTQATQDPAEAFRQLALGEDLAAAKHESLAAAGTQISRIYAGNTRVLKQFGITTKDTGKALQQLGDRLAGQASAQADNFNGKLRAMEARAHDLVGQFGAKAGPAITTFGLAMAGAGGAVQVFAALSAKATREGRSLMSVIGGMGVGLGVTAAALTAGVVVWQIWSQHAAVAKQHAADFAEAIKEDNGAIGENTKVLLVNRLTSDGAYTAALKLGISQQQLTDALLKGGPALAFVNQKMAEYTPTVGAAAGKGGAFSRVVSEQGYAVDKLGGILPGVTKDIAKGGEEAKNYAAAMDDSNTKTQESIAAAEHHSAWLKKVAAHTKEVAAAEKAAADATAALSHQWDILTGKLSADEAELAANQSILDLTDTLKKNKDAWSAKTAAGIADRKAALDSINSFLDQAQALQKEGKSNEYVNRTYDAHISQLRKVLHAAGLTKSQIDDLVGAYKKLPQKVSTTLEIDAIFNRAAEAAASRAASHGTFHQRNSGRQGRWGGGRGAAGRSYLVGEYEPEVLNLDPAGNAEMTPLSKAGGMGNVTIHVDARGASDPMAVQAAAEAGATVAVERLTRLLAGRRG